MKKDSRLIRVIGQIDEEAFKSFSEALHEYELQSDKSVTLELNSEGGTAYDALAFAGRMRDSSCNIIVKVHGIAFSAAVMVLAAGDERLMSKESWAMVHEDSVKLKANVSELEREISHHRRMENQWNALLEELTETNYASWERLHKNSEYLDAKQCLELGLIDRII